MLDVDLLAALQMETVETMEKMQVKAQNKQDRQSSDFSNKLQELNKLAEAADREKLGRLRAISRQMAKLQMEERNAAMERHHKLMKLAEKIETQRLRDIKETNFENARNGTKKAPIFTRVSGVEL